MVDEEVAEVVEAAEVEVEGECLIWMVMLISGSLEMQLRPGRMVHCVGNE